MRSWGVDGNIELFTNNIVWCKYYVNTNSAYSKTLLWKGYNLICSIIDIICCALREYISCSRPTCTMRWRNDLILNLSCQFQPFFRNTNTFIQEPSTEVWKSGVSKIHSYMHILIRHRDIYATKVHSPNVLFRYYFIIPVIVRMDMNVDD